jgi:hypothetical protein
MILLTGYSIETSTLLRLPWCLVVSRVAANVSGGTLLFFLSRIKELHVSLSLIVVRIQYYGQ